MVFVRGSAATPNGFLPTGIVAFTLICAVTGRAMARAGCPEAAAAAAGQIAAMATVTRMKACQIRRMMSRLLGGHASVHSASPARPAVVPSVLTSGHAASLPRPQYFVIRPRADLIVRASGRASQAARAGEESARSAAAAGKPTAAAITVQRAQPGTIMDVSARYSLPWPDCLV